MTTKTKLAIFAIAVVVVISAIFILDNIWNDVNDSIKVDILLVTNQTTLGQQLQYPDDLKFSANAKLLSKN